MATARPKIPDGKCSLSAGQTFQALTPFKQQEDVMTIILYPGLGGGAVINGSTEDKILQYDQHGSFTRVNESRIVADAESTNDIAQWRVVSQGMKLSLLNNADKNDGFYETVRFTASRDPEFFNLSTSAAPNASAPDGESGLVVAPVVGQTDPLPTRMMGVDLDKLIDHPTYRTGKLRDIQKANFILKQESNEHDFIRLDSAYDDSDGVVNTSPTIGVVKQTPAGHRLVEQTIDPSLDIIVVRIHGRTDNNNPSNVLCHLISHHEICYENGTRLSRFHNETEDITNSIASRTRSKTRARGFGPGFQINGKRARWHVRRRGHRNWIY